MPKASKSVCFSQYSLTPWPMWSFCFVLFQQCNVLLKQRNGLLRIVSLTNEMKLWCKKSKRFKWTKQHKLSMNMLANSKRLRLKHHNLCEKHIMQVLPSCTDTLLAIKLVILKLMYPSRSSIEEIPGLQDWAAVQSYFLWTTNNCSVTITLFCHLFIWIFNFFVPDTDHSHIGKCMCWYQVPVSLHLEI